MGNDETDPVDDAADSCSETDQECTTTEPTTNYRGTIPTEDWEEFKRNVPRSITLPKKINELIREFNERQRGED